MAKKEKRSKEVKLPKTLILIEWKRITVFIIFAVLILSVLAFNFGLFKKTCTDSECFDAALVKCQPAKYEVVKNNNLYSYIIKREMGDICKIEIKLLAMAEGSDVTKVAQFEGKSMICEVPKDHLNDVSSDNLKGILNYCSGELKEALYEEIIKKLYGLVLINLEDVASEIDGALAGI
ncbi:MAG: hypothetical protein ABIF40_04715 [archaeon]